MTEMRILYSVSKISTKCLHLHWGSQTFSFFGAGRRQTLA